MAQEPRVSTPIVKVGLVTIDAAGRMLVVRKRGGRTYILPGGKPEGEESDHTCLARELMEELGVHLRGASVYLGTFGAMAADMVGTMVMVRAYRGELHGDPSPQAEIEEMRWVDMRNPDVPLSESILTGVIPAVLRGS